MTVNNPEELYGDLQCNPAWFCIFLRSKDEFLERYNYTEECYDKVRDLIE